jgi:hypothetical protein
MVRRGFGSLSGVYSFNTWPSEITVGEGERIYPVGLIEAKAMLPVNTDMHDTLIGLLIAGTTGQVERYIGRDTYAKTRVAQYERPADVLSLPYGPHGAVSLVQGIDIDGNATTLTATTDYTVEGIEFTTASGQLLADIRSRLGGLEAQWIQQAKGKGIDGAKLAAEARALIAKHAK